MTISDPEKLAQYIRSLPEFVMYETIDGNYNHMGATVADAVLQARNSYATHVKPRVNRILATYPVARSTTAVLHLLEGISATEFLFWRGEDRAERFSRILGLFASEDIETEADLRDWLINNANLPKLRSINGIGPKTVDYFKILVGISTSAIDRHLLNFLGVAGLTPCGYNEAQAIINATADILSVDRAYFDHSIWQFMSRRTAQSCVSECDGDVGQAKQQQAGARAQQQPSASQEKNGKSAKTWLRELLSVRGAQYTLADLVLRTGKTEVNIRTILSDLRSAKYCGSGGVFNTKSVRKDGKVYYSKV